MATLSRVSTIFTVKYEEDSRALANLIPQLDEQSTKTAELSMFSLSNPNDFSETSNALRTSFMETQKFITLIPRLVLLKDYGVPLPANTPIAPVDYNSKIVVSYDSEGRAQGFGLLLLDKTFREEKSIEFYSIITAFRNLRCPQAESEPNRVRGAGSSIINFCKEECKRLKAKYLRLDAATTAISFYEKHEFKIVESDTSSVDPAMLAEALRMGVMRTPMVYEL